MFFQVIQILFSNITFYRRYINIHGILSLVFYEIPRGRTNEKRTPGQSTCSIVKIERKFGIIYGMGFGICKGMW